MNKARRFFNLDSELDLQKVIDFVERVTNNPFAVIDAEAHYNNTFVLVEATEPELDKIEAFVDEL